MSKVTKEWQIEALHDFRHMLGELNEDELRLILKRLDPKVMYGDVWTRPALIHIIICAYTNILANRKEFKWN